MSRNLKRLKSSRYETLPGAPQLGSFEHIQKSVEVLGSTGVRSITKLREVLLVYSIPESFAYFIFQNQMLRREAGRDPRTAVIDTRELSGYNRGPIFEAEFHYDPHQDNSHLFMLSRPYPNDLPRLDRTHHLRIPMDNSLDLAVNRPIESYSHLGHPRKASDVKTFRTSADPFYKSERNPKHFVNTLGEMVVGLERFMYIRDEL